MNFELQKQYRPNSLIHIVYSILYIGFSCSEIWSYFNHIQMRRIYTLLLCVLFGINSYGKDYYVSPKGSGNKSGIDFSNAIHGRFLSLKLLDAKPGDVFHLMEGEYHASSDEKGGVMNMYSFVFLLNDGVTIKGGYNSKGEYLGETDNSASKTILDGRTVQQIAMENSDYDEFDWDYQWQPSGWWNRWLSDNSLSVVKVNENAKNVNIINLTIKQYTNSYSKESRIGSGIYVDRGADLNLSFVNIVGGRSDLRAQTNGNGGGLYSKGNRITVKYCSFSGNEAQADGGAIYLESGIATINQTLFKNNKAENGAAVYSAFSTQLNLYNSTLTANQASVQGGGLFLNGDAVLIGSTIARNTAPADNGCYQNTGSFRMLNSIMVDHIMVKNYNELKNSIIGSSFFYTQEKEITNVFDADLYLKPLANNGGPTQTMAMDRLKTNWAIGRGSLDGIDPSLHFDQRGMQRAFEKSWLGAYEEEIRIEAISDHYNILENSSKNSFDVLANDLLLHCTVSDIEFSLTTFLPKHGTVLIENKKLIYLPEVDFVGRDSVMYRITDCHNALYSDSAWIYINIAEKPDNIVDVDVCTVEMPSIDFKIKQQWSTEGAGNPNTSVLVGDLTGDGLPEIIAYAPSLGAIQVLDGRTGELKTSVGIPSAFAEQGWQAAMTAVIVDADRNNKGEIIIANSDKSIVSYELNIDSENNYKLIQKWKVENAFESPSKQTDNITEEAHPQPIVTDFNGDGVPELVVYNRIFNAVNGSYIGETENIRDAFVGRVPFRTHNKSTNFNTVADFDGDGLPELVAGGKVYKVVINNTGTTAVSSILYQTEHIGDGFTSVADVDLDGVLDVVVSNVIVNPLTLDNEFWLHIWTPQRSEIIDQFMVAKTSSNQYANALSFPLIGDIDGEVIEGKKIPEICVLSRMNLFAFKYNPTIKKYVKKWQFGIDDSSGGTGVTLFDFDNDGINELVYRDEAYLRILNGVGDKVILADSEAKFECKSWTAWEYPVIADTDGDGSANIVVTCFDKESKNYVRVYESGSKPWAPTRKVWNRVNYEPLQVNENLTIPKYFLPKNTSFANKFPYNGSLIQVPLVNNDFNPIVSSPDISIESIYKERLDETSMRIYIEILNKGIKHSNSGLPIALYNNANFTPPSLAVKEVGKSIAPGESYTIYFDISLQNVSPQMGVRLQDATPSTGNTSIYPAPGSYLDCDYGNNSKQFSGLLAVDDYLVLKKGETKRIKVLENDIILGCSRPTTFDTIPNSGLNHGSLTINLLDSSFIYTPHKNFVGVDSVEYYIKCNADSSAAKVYFLVIDPVALEYHACPGSVVSLGFNNTSDLTYNWYNNEELVVNTTPQWSVVKDDSSVQTWMVQAVWKHITFPQVPVYLYLAATCGDNEPQGCAANGTVLFNEDFGGNNADDPKVKENGIPQVIGYNYNKIPVGKKKYALSKSSYERTDIYKDYWYVIGDDHTSPNDNTIGYLLQVDASADPGQFYEHTIDNLLPGTQLYFSTWLASVSVNPNSPHKVNMIFLLEDEDANVIAQYYTGNIPDGDPTWKQYGFLFTVPENTTYLKLRIINNGLGSGNGNDFVMDDVEVRFCAPPVEIIPKTDTLVCVNTELQLKATYIDDGTFGENLIYRWEFRATKTDEWKTWKTGTGTSPLIADSTIGNISSHDQGYYRLLIGNSLSNINGIAVSKEIFVKVRELIVASDIRVQAMENVGEINLSLYLHEAEYNDNWNIFWEKASAYVFPEIEDNEKGTINWLNDSNNQKYRYRITNECNSSYGILHISSIRSSFLQKRTVEICKDQAEYINLSKIFGLEANGTIEAVTTGIDKYINRPTNIFEGSTILNGLEIWDDPEIIPINTLNDKIVLLKYKFDEGSLQGEDVLLEIILYNSR